jgi:hypothetical protein
MESLLCILSKAVSERLAHPSITITLDTYIQVLPGIQEAGAERFDRMLEPDVSNSVCKRVVLNVRRTGLEPVTG